MMETENHKEMNMELQNDFVEKEQHFQICRKELEITIDSLLQKCKTLQMERNRLNDQIGLMNKL